MQVITRTTCRICESELKDVFSLGEHYVNDFPEKWPHEGPKCPIDLVQCLNPECELLQLRHTVDAETLYKGNYWYKSGINPIIVDDLKQIANSQVGYKEGDVWIDIGANDGTLLKHVPIEYYTIGVEPAKNMREELTRCADNPIFDIWENVRTDQADVITAIGMFYDSENPNDFIANVKRHLKPNGVFIAQMMTLKPMLYNNDVGNLCHEHLEFYSYKSLKFLFEKNGLEIFKISENEINGGSYRIFARHLSGPSIDYPEEYDIELFIERVEAHKNDTVAFLKKKAAEGKKVYGFGASTKGNTILQYYNLGPEILSGVADANPVKFGKYMLTGVPIVDEEVAREKADIFFILPWGFTQFFLKKERTWRENGGRFVTSIPRFQIWK